MRAEEPEKGLEKVGWSGSHAEKTDRKIKGERARKSQKIKSSSKWLACGKTKLVPFVKCPDLCRRQPRNALEGGG